MVGLSSVLGAFFAGIAIGQTNVKKSVNKNTETIGYSIFIPVFFITIGLKISLNGVINNFFLFLLLTIGSVSSKLIGAGIGAKLAGFERSSSLVIGAGMVSRGEMALVIAQTNTLLNPDSYSAVVGSVIVTTLIAPFLLRSAIINQENQ